MQVLRDAVEDPSVAAAAVAAANAALEEDEWPGLRPPRKRQKRTAPGQAQVRGVPGLLNSPAAVCDVPKCNISVEECLVVLLLKTQHAAAGPLSFLFSAFLRHC